ncbi:MAG: hypothetical protein MJ092_03970 [Lachnospiraceae bacterium]|nr:hypothetical protein [Lachnospiraceae bacterium]
MKKNGSKLGWGIALVAIGVVGLGNAGGEEVSFYAVCFALIIVGGILLARYFINRKNEQNRLRKQQEDEERTREARRRAAEARAQAEELKYREAQEKAQAELNAVKVCKSCGAATKGHFCEYCGSKLD